MNQKHKTPITIIADFKIYKIILVALFLFCAFPAFSQKSPAAKGTLKDAYKNAFMMGAAVNEAIVSGKDEASQKIVVQQFNTVTLENGMKAELINPKPGVFNYGPADA